MGTILMKRYSNEPRIINMKYPGSCKDCSCSLKKGDRAFYWPLLKEVKCHDCGDQDYRDFLSNAADEDVYHGRGNPFC
jgi:hypothetical protein